MKKIFQLIMVASAMLVVTSCGEEEDFTESIFDTGIATVDQDAATAPFDQWLYDNFVVPYNTEIQYKFNFTASDLSYQLAPADYKKSQLLSHFIKYLFYEVYDKYGEKDQNGNDIFMKSYGPRIFHFIGSAAYSPTTGTETLGYASAGVKITLINVNDMRTVTQGMDFTPEDMFVLNEKQFHTMHHEFSHILHQTKTYPTSFGIVTAGTYDPRSWQDRDSCDSHTMGYVTHYASSATYEDFVETLSCTITDTDDRWMNTIIECCLNGGVKAGDKELVYTLIDSLEIDNFADPTMHWNNFTIHEELYKDSDTGEETHTRYILDSHLEDSKRHLSSNLNNSTEYGKYNWKEYKTFTSFDEFMEWVPYDASDETKGINALLKKIDIATKWYTEYWGLYLYTIRREVDYRQKHINEYVHSDDCVIYDYQ
jgi:substrate import-associated zinc metallohydrolase lipoprotein